MGSSIYTSRNATADDFNFLYSVVVAVRTSHREYDEAEELREFTNHFMLKGLYVIGYQGQDVGRLRYIRNAEYLYIGGLQILPVYQRHGIGSAILADLIRLATRLRVDVVLEVHEGNAGAKRLYEKCGFATMGRHPEHASAIVMRYFTER